MLSKHSLQSLKSGGRFVYRPCETLSFNVVYSGIYKHYVVYIYNVNGLPVDILKSDDESRIIFTMSSITHSSLWEKI